VTATPAQIAAAVPDPEMPEVTLGDLGIVRMVEVGSGCVTVTITPTYLGCPAVEVMAADIVAALQQAGWDRVDVQTSLSPAWSTAWITSEGRAKLGAAGIVPPPLGPDLHHALAELVPCPRCASRRTRRRSLFGSSPCREAFVCEGCGEPFERVKPV
jgi:ring-1,2-phenylacetyl-CoA epoxidase subunit PaaD